MKIIADENIDRLVIDFLRSEGHEVIGIAKSMPSIADIDVLSLSRVERALLITEDKDFGDLVFHRRHSHFGVLLIRLEGMSRSDRVQLVVETILARGSELASSFSVLKPGSLRSRQLD